MRQRRRWAAAPRRAAATGLCLALLGAPLAVSPTRPAFADITAATPDTAVVTVQVGGDRTGARGVTALGGVVLGFFSDPTGGDSIVRCTSDADGDCNLVLDDTGVGGPDRGRRFWVRPVSVPDGWSANPTLGTSADGGDIEETDYRFQTPPLYGGQVYRSGFDLMTGADGGSRTASGGLWQQSRDNPALPGGCGLDVALVLDLSDSVGPALPALKQAAGTVVDALVGTPSRVSLFSFSDDSPAAGGANFPSLTSVSTEAGAAAVKARWSSWTADGGTNWDRGLARVAAATDAVDLAVLITGGTPSLRDGPGRSTRFADVEAAVFSANAIKAREARVLAVGIGDAVDGASSALGLRAVSGPVAYDPGSSNAASADYVQAPDYAAAGAVLRDLVLARCAGSVSVTKQIVPSTATGEDVSDAEPAPGEWTFEAAGSPGVAVDPPTERSTTDDGTATVTFPLSFAGGTAGGQVTLTEQQQPGYQVVTQGGDNAICRDLRTGASLPVTDAGALGFSVAAAAASPVACTVFNRAPQPLASVRVDKTWVVNGVRYADGEQPDALQARLELSGPRDQPASPQSWGAPRAGYQPGDEATLDETILSSPGDLCTLDSRTVNGQNLPYTAELSAGENRYTITNTLTCRAQLSLAKRVANGSAEPTTWRLSAAGPDGALPGPTGSTGSSGFVTPDVAYTLREDGGDADYEQRDVDGDAANASWLCVEVTPDGLEQPGFRGGLDGAVTVPTGSRVRCTAVNQTALLRLRKLVDDPTGTAAPSDWTLTATPVDPPTGVTPQSTTGSADYVTLEVRPGVTYAITESGPDGFARSVRCGVGAEPPAERATLAVPALEVGACTVTNQRESSPTPSQSPSSSATAISPSDPPEAGPEVDSDATLADTGGPGRALTGLGVLLILAASGLWSLARRRERRDPRTWRAEPS